MKVLGIDFGTTSLKVCVVDEARAVLYESQKRHESEFEPGKQNVEKTMRLACEMIKNAREKVGTIAHIAVAGQMHGVVLANGEQLERGEVRTSPLYTWQFSGCDDVLEEVSSQSPEQLFNGYGCATLTYLYKTKQFDSSWNVAGTIMDIFVSYLSSHGAPTISSQNAFSWGCCDGEAWTCQGDLFPKSWLPTILSAGHIVGNISKTIGRDIHCEDSTLSVPLGDLQASVYPHLTEDSAVLNIGTSSQICALVPDNFVKPNNLRHLRVDPFHSKKKLLVAAGLNGGSALDAFVKNMRKWSSEMFGMTTETVNYSDVIEGINAAAHGDTNKENAVTVRPTFDGERGLPHLRGANICGLTSETSLMEILLSLSSGVIDALFTLLPASYLRELGIKNLLLTGTASEPRYCRRIEQVCREHGMNVIKTTENVCAAYGAAVFALEHTEINDPSPFST